MSLDNPSTLVALLVSLSITSERIVEIAKGFIPFLNKSQELDSMKE
jgi:hypothetical protein